MAGRPAPRTLGMVLAGGEGRRLGPLTEHRAKPAVPFAGRYRIVDVVLSNFVNSGVTKVKVVTQYKSHSLETHLARAWRLSPMLDQYVEPFPAQQRTGKSWFKGSADAVWQCRNAITDEHADVVCVFGGDHVYKMDLRQMIDAHLARGAEMTVAAIPVALADAPSFGVLEADADGWMVGFEEKPAAPQPMPARPDHALASMGNYVFDAEVLLAELERDADRDDGTHDFGRDVLPAMLGRRVLVYDFSTNEVPGEDARERGYWRDIGTVDAYHDAHMDLCAIQPQFNLYNEHWPIRTIVRTDPPAKFVFSDEASARVGAATDSLVSEGCIVSGGRIHRSVLSPRVRINSFALVEESVLLDGVEVGRHAKIRRAVVDKDVRIPAEFTIGYDAETDARFFRSEGGILVVPKGTML